MMKLGTQTLSALYLGGQNIKKAYLGGELVFGNEAGPSRLPDGYAEVEYIQSSEGCYINTLFKPTTTFKITMDVWPEHVTHNGYFFNSYAYVSSQALYYSSCYMDINEKLLAKFGQYVSSGSWRTVVTNLDLKRMVVSWDSNNKTLSIDDVTSTWSSFAVHTSMPYLTILGTTGSYSTLAGKLYSCQIENNGALVRDFVPCIDPSGAVGVYDLVGNQFYGNAGTGAFTAGPAV